MYYCFDDLDRYDSQLILNYLIDTEPVPEAMCKDEGFEDYLRYSNNFISEKLGRGLTPYILRTCFEDLEKHNYIFIHHQLDKHGNACKNNYRYIKLNHEKIAQAVGIDTSIPGWDTPAEEEAKEQYYYTVY